MRFTHIKKETMRNWQYNNDHQKHSERKKKVNRNWAQTSSDEEGSTTGTLRFNRVSSLLFFHPLVFFIPLLRSQWSFPNRNLISMFDIILCFNYIYLKRFCLLGCQVYSECWQNWLEDIDLIFFSVFDSVWVVQLWLFWDWTWRGWFIFMSCMIWSRSVELFQASELYD